MGTLGATLEHVSPGQVEIAMRPRVEISQQHGFVHAGAVSAIADSAAGYAALTMTPDGTGVLTTEFKINRDDHGSESAAGARRLKVSDTLPRGVDR